MNIIDAAKTGKLIRAIDGNGFWYAPGALIPYALIQHDWEVEETPITLTRAQFDAACAKVEDQWSMPRRMLTNLASELGFGEGEK